MLLMLLMFTFGVQSATSDECSTRILKPRYCQKGFWITEIDEATRINGQCKYEYKLKVETPKCTTKKTKQGTCEKSRDGRFSCLRRDTVYTYKINDQCQCMKQKVERERICCCPDPMTFRICDKNKGEKVIITTEYQLIDNGIESSCKETVNKQIRTLTVKDESMETRSCNDDRTQLRIFRNNLLDDSCNEVSVERKDFRTCSCTKDKKQETECSGDSIITRTFASRLECCECSCQCVDTIVSTKESTIECPNPTVKISACTYPGNRRKVTTIQYNLENCKCIEKKSSIFEKCTSCPYHVEKVQIGECCRSRKIKIITTYYRDTDCNNKIKRTEEICGCPKPPKDRITCKNGAWYKLVTKIEFNKITKTCITKSTELLNRYVQCPPPTITFGRCNAERKYYERKTTVEHNLDFVKCLCKDEKRIEFLICDHPPAIIGKWECQGNDHKVRRTKKYVINKARNQYDEKVDIDDVMVSCNENIAPKIEYHHRIIITTRFYKIVKNCKCQTKTVTTKRITRCDDPTNIVKCINQHTKQTTLTTFTLNLDHTKCLTAEFKRNRRIVCPTYLKVSRSRCKGGHFWIIKKHYGVRNCKCVLLRKERNPVVIKCNVEKPLVTKTCEGNKWKTRKTTWTIKNCLCLSKTETVSRCIVCRPTKRIFSKCNRKTGFITVRTIRHIAVNCKCVTQISTYYKLKCPCLRPDKIEKSKCVGRKRIVNKLRSKSVGKTCQWVVIKTESEDCTCCVDRTIKSCHDKTKELTTTISYQLVMSYLKLPVFRCVRQVKSIARPIVCNKNYTYTTPCKNLYQRIVSCTYKVLNCVCVKTCKTLCVRACNCRAKNECKTKCVNNVSQRICNKYSDNGSGCGHRRGRSIVDCVKSESVDILPVSCCQPKNRRSCTKCTIERNHGFYKKCTLQKRVKVNCRCNLKTKIIDELCKCRESQSKSSCRNNRVVVHTTTYTRRHDKCVESISEYENQEIVCPKSYFITEERACSTRYTLVYYDKVNCHCIKKHIRKDNPKCPKKCKVEKICSGKQWEFTKHSWIQRRTNVKLFNEVRDSPMKTFCNHVVKKWNKPIRCDRDSYTRWCDTIKEILHTIRTYYVVENCKCIRRTTHSTKPCVKCPKTEEHPGKCDNRNLNTVGYLDLTIIKYELTRNNDCKKVVYHQKKICRCPRTSYNDICRNGNLIHQKISHIFASNPPCKKQICSKTEPVYCYNGGKANKWRLGLVERCRKPGEFSIANYDRHEFVNCLCIRKTKKENIGICCKPCFSVIKCIRNQKVVITTCERPVKLKCVVIRHQKVSGISCPSSIKTLLAPSVDCVQRYFLTKFININCKCIRKRSNVLTEQICCKPETTREKICEGKRWKITTTTYLPENGLCKIAQKEVEYEDPCTCESDDERTEDKQIDKFHFVRSYYRKRMVNCKYQEYLHHTEKLSSRCLDSHEEITCRHDRTIVITLHYFKLCHGHCIPRCKRSFRPTDCSHLVLFERLPNGICKVKDIKYVAVYKNCKCKRKVRKISKKRVCCHDLKPFTKKICDERRGVTITKNYIFHLINNECIPIVASSTVVKVNCNRKYCHTIVSPCVNNNNVVSLYCLRRHKCRCLKKLVYKGNQCCKPESYEWSVVERCNQSIGFRKTKYFAFRLDKDRQLCKPVVIRVQKKTCDCPKKSRHVGECRNDVSRTITVFTFTWNDERDTCIRNTRKYIKTTPGCSNRIRRVRIVSRKCDSRTGWEHITTEYIQAKNCHCVKSHRVTRCPCVCHVAYPTTVRKYCKDNQVVTETRKAVCRRCHARWTVCRKSTKIDNCAKIVIEKGNCFPMRDGNAVSVRYVSKIQYLSIKCKCVRREIEKWKVHCVCLKSTIDRRCLTSQILKTYHQYSINKKGICQHDSRQETIKIPCPTTPSVTKSKCHNNKYEIATRIFYNSNCKCLSKTYRKECECKCPKNSVTKRCTGKYFIEEITTTWRKVHCRCKKSQNARQYLPQCPRFISRTVEACVKKGNTGYQLIIRRSLCKRSDICKCVIKVKHRRKRCWCKENKKVIQFCANNNISVTEISKRVLCNRSNRCKRIVTTYSRKIIAVPSDVVTYYCNKNTGIDQIVTRRYHINNCVIKYTIHKDFGRCECPKKWKRVKKGVCSASKKYLRTDMYVRKQLVGRRCVKVKEIKTVVCDCRPISSKKYCKNNQWYTSITTFKLIHHVCIYKINTTVRQVSCSLNIITEKGNCTSAGYKVIRKYKYFNRNCHCVKEKIKEFSCKCRCPKRCVKNHCDRTAQVHTTTITSFSIIRCKCIARIESIKVRIPCPGQSIKISGCIPVRGKDYSERTTTTITYYVNEHCKCVQKIDIEKEICDCHRREQTQNICDRIRHVITLRTSYTVLRNKACVRIRTFKKKIVSCGTGRWSLKGDSGCIADNKYGRRVLTYVRQIVVGCGCKEESRQRLCNCMCHGRRQSNKCHKNRIEIIHTHYTYKIINCKCVVTKRIHYEPIKCKSLPSIVQPCILYKDGIYRKYTIHRDRRVCNCKCITIPRKTWIICKCPDQTNNQHCNKVKNVIVKTRTWYQLFPDQCRRQTKRILVPVPCDTTPDCIAHSKCSKGRRKTQIYKCIHRTLSNCQCKAETKKKIYSCTCRRRKIVKGECNEDSRRRIVTTTRYYLIVHRNGRTNCVPNVTSRKERCKCRKPTETIICRNNKLIKTTISFAFNIKCKTCKKIIREINLTPKCCPTIERKKEKCPGRPSCNQIFHETHKTLVNCKCNITKRQYTRKCCCKLPYTTSICIGDNTRKYIRHSFNLIRGRCIKRSSATYKSISCPKKVSRYIRWCTRPSCIQTKKIVTYTVKHCQCKKSVKTKQEICCCKYPVSKEICLPREGIYQKTVTSYFFDRLRHRCLVSRSISTRRACCDTKRRKSCDLCNVSYKSGTYKRCTTTFGVRSGCSCNYRSEVHFELCTCPKETSSSFCLNHSTKLRISRFYVPIKSKDRCHDFVCDKNSKVVRREIVVCPRSIIKGGPCIRRIKIYTEYYYNVINCGCVLREKQYKVTCRCRNLKIEKTCMNNFLTVIFYRRQTLVCYSRHWIPICKCMKTDYKLTIPTNCRRRHYVVEKCIGKYQRLRFVQYKINNCKCERSERSITRPCEECKSEMPLCQKITSIGLCKRRLYREYLCQFTCRYCERCPKKCETKSIGPCKCRKVAGIKICSKKIEFIRYRIVKRKCVPHRSVRYSLCSCSLEYSKSKCERLKKQGRCKEIKIMRKCQFVCNGSCQACQGSVVQRRCVQFGPRIGTFKVVNVAFKRVCNSCITTISVRYRGSCSPCDKTQRKIISRCVRGTRTVVTNYVKKEQYRCVNKQSSASYSCSGCCKSTETKIGNCVKGRRTVLTVFWANINNCCKKQTVTNVYLCHRLFKQVTTVTTRCIDGKHMVIRRWKSGRQGISHSVAEIRSCIPFVN